MAEARGALRYPVQLPVRIAGDDSTRMQEAVSDNISGSGIYIRSQSRFEVGAHIQVEITLPAEAIGTPDAVTVRCDAHVVRADETGSQKETGLACIIDEYNFVRSGARA